MLGGATQVFPRNALGIVCAIEDRVENVEDRIGNKTYRHSVPPSEPPK
jgi:hypothetical protein